MNKVYSYLLIGCCALALVIWSCSDDDSNSSGNGSDNFDRQAMIVNWADNIIVPAYQTFGSKVATLKTAADAFENSTTQTNFNALRTSWEEAYIAFQNVQLFLAGPAENVFFIPTTTGARSLINTYPTNAENIDAFISSGNYDLTQNSTFDEKGFPALDYLLFGIADTDSDILALYTGVNATNYLNYLTDVVDDLNTRTTNVVSQWQGSYRSAFVNNSSSAASSSIDIFANAYLAYFELLFRNGKIGIPAGVSAQGAGEPQPQLVEAFYKKDLSKTLYLEALNALQDFFNGTAFNGTTNGESFKSYLNFLNAITDGEDLSTLINNQFETIRTTANTLDDSFYNQINTNNTSMLNTYEAMQGMIVYLKSNMFSALDIALTFDSGDGD